MPSLSNFMKNIKSVVTVSRYLPFFYKQQQGAREMGKTIEPFKINHIHLEKRFIDGT